jgi:hypothetical protein
MAAASGPAKIGEMKAVYFAKPGGPEVLEFRNVPKPTLRPYDVLILVKAIGINPIDCKVRVCIAPSCVLLCFLFFFW